MKYCSVPKSEARCREVQVLIHSGAIEMTSETI